MRKITPLASAFIYYSKLGLKVQVVAHVLQKLKALEMPFIENRGQTDERVAYYAKTFGGMLSNK